MGAGVSRVVCSSVDPNPKVAGRGIERLEAAGIAVSVGALAEEARALNGGYFSRFERARPLIRLKLAMSLDGRTAPAPGSAAKRWISGEAARADVQHWRARSSAVLTGAGTVRADDPQLNVRLSYGAWVRQPLRVVLDPDLTCPPAARIFKGGGALLFAAEAAALPGKLAALLPPVIVERVPARGRALDLPSVVTRLASLEINELLVECGATLAAAFLEAQLIDELILYVAPVLLGTEAAPLTALRSSHATGPFTQFDLRAVERFDADVRLILTPKGI
jgi:diaminohydroxyphosphoribosylaminopyrimidine deaminase/5-amino-6-(5-phosphoribosylamino)uracil reductase